MTKIHTFANIFTVKLLLNNVINDTVNKMIQKELVYLLEKYGMSKEELSERSGVPYETVRNLYYGRVENPKASTLIAISRVLNVSVNRLAGERLFSNDEESLIANYRRCSQHGKNMIEFVARFEADLTKHEREADNKYKIPCIIPIGAVEDGVRYCSGNMTYIDTDNSKACFAVEFNTNRLAPAFCEGDRVLIEDRFPNSGETAIFMRDDLLYCRQFIKHDNGYTLKSHTMKQRDFEFKRMDQIKCIGTCIGVIRA